MTDRTTNHPADDAANHLRDHNPYRGGFGSTGVN